MIFKCMLSWSAMVTFIIEHCKRLGTKFKMTDVSEKDLSLANLSLRPFVLQISLIKISYNFI